MRSFEAAARRGRSGGRRPATNELESRSLSLFRTCLGQVKDPIVQCTKDHFSEHVNVRPVQISDYRALARAASGPSPTVFFADAERRQDFDHAGGDRAAV